MDSNPASTRPYTRSQTKGEVGYAIESSLQKVDISGGAQEVHDWSQGLLQQQRIVHEAGAAMNVTQLSKPAQSKAVTWKTQGSSVLGNSQVQALLQQVKEQEQALKAAQKYIKVADKKTAEAVAKAVKTENAKIKATEKAYIFKLEVETLKEQLQSVPRQRRSVHPTQQQNASKTELLQQLNAVKAQARRAAQEAAEAIAAKNDSLQQVLTESQVDRQNAQQAADVAAARIARLEQQLETSVAEAEQCKQLIERMRLDFGASKAAEVERAAAYANSITELQNQLQQSEGEKQQAAETASDHATEIQRLLQLVQQADSQVSRMAVLQSQLDDSHFRNTQLAAAADEQQSRMISLEQQLKQAKRDTQQAQTQAAETAHHISQLKHQLSCVQGRDHAHSGHADLDYKPLPAIHNMSFSQQSRYDSSGKAVAAADLPSPDDDHVPLGSPPTLDTACAADAAEQADAADQTCAMHSSHAVLQNTHSSDKLGAANVLAGQVAPGSPAVPQATCSATSATAHTGQAGNSPQDTVKAAACAVMVEAEQPAVLIPTATTAADAATKDESPDHVMVRHVASSGTALSTDEVQSQHAQYIQPLVPKSSHEDEDISTVPSRGAPLTASSQPADAQAAPSASLHMWPTSLNRTGYCNQLYEAEAPDSKAPQFDNIKSNQPHVISNASVPGNNTHKQTAQHAASTDAAQPQTGPPDTQLHGVSTAAKPDVHSMAQPHQAADSLAHPTSTSADAAAYESGSMMLSDDAPGTAKVAAVTSSITSATSTASEEGNGGLTSTLAGTKRLALEGIDVDASQLGGPDTKRPKHGVTAAEGSTYIVLPAPALPVPRYHSTAVPVRGNVYLGKRQPAERLRQGQAEDSTLQVPTASSPNTRPRKQPKCSVLDGPFNFSFCMGAVPKADTTHRRRAWQPMSRNYNLPDMAPSNTEGAVETEQARSDLLTASDNAGVHSSQQQPSVLDASVLIAAAELLEQEDRQQNNSTAEDPPAAVTYNATPEESMASGSENSAASNEAGYGRRDAVSDRPDVVSLQQGNHAASTPPLSSDSDTEDHVSTSAAAADQYQQQEPTSHMFQDHQHAQASDNDLINHQPLNEDIQDGYQQHPEERTQDAEAMQQLPEAQGIHEEHGPSLYSEEGELWSEESWDNPVQQWAQQDQFQEHQTQQMQYAEEESNDEPCDEKHSNFVSHLHTKGAGLEDIVRTRSERISELHACIAEVQLRMEREPGTEHTLRQPLEATNRKLAYHERQYPCLVKQLKDVVFGLEQIGEDVSAVKWHLADLLEMPDWDQQSQTSDDETVEEGQSKTVAPVVDEKQGLDWEDDERMEEEDSDEAPELFDISSAAPHVPTVQVPSRWNLRADPRKWSRLGPGDPPRGHPWSADFGDDFFRKKAAELLALHRAYHASPRDPLEYLRAVMRRQQLQ